MTLPSLDALPPIEMQRGGDPGLLFAELKDVIARAITEHPRSKQRRIGPSEIGETCARKLAYKVSGTTEARVQAPGWKPTVGTAVHAWLEEQFVTAPGIDGASRWLVETRVNAGPMAGTELTGSTDLYDRVTATCIDWKNLGVSAMKTLRADLNAGRGPKTVYRVQLHTYGLGFANRGLPVDRVMLVALPRDGELDQALMWSEAYNPQVALDAMARVDRIHALAAGLGMHGSLTATNGVLQSIGAGHLADPSGTTADLAIATDAGSCRFCPWHVPASTDLTRACPGDAEATERGLTRATKGLIPPQATR